MSLILTFPRSPLSFQCFNLTFRWHIQHSSKLVGKEQIRTSIIVSLINEWQEIELLKRRNYSFRVLKITRIFPTKSKKFRKPKKTEGNEKVSN
jgi:hypothetical protein